VIPVVHRTDRYARRVGVAAAREMNRAGLVWRLRAK
jgi:hypothetical protein